MQDFAAAVTQNSPRKGDGRLLTSLATKTIDQTNCPWRQQNRIDPVSDQG